MDVYWIQTNRQTSKVYIWKYIIYIYILDASLMNFNGVRFGMAWFGLDRTPHCEILSKSLFHFSQAIFRILIKFN